MVRELLAPLGTAEQIRAELLDNTSLREQFETMAADTVTMGYQIARLALTYYLDYAYPLSNPRSVEADDQELLPTEERDVPAVRVYPNPAIGSTHIVCGAGIKNGVSGEVRLYNRLGLLVRTQALDQKTPEGTALDLRGLLPGLYQYVVQLGDQAPTRGTLVHDLHSC